MIKSVLPAGTTLHGKMNYTIDQCLAQGGFGVTYLAKGTLKIDNIVHEVPFAIKEFYIEQSCQRAANGEIIVYPSAEESLEVHKERFLNEAERLHNMKPHKGIVSVNEVFRQNNTIYYVMKYLGNTNLTKYVASKGGALDEKEATEIFVNVAKALQHLHSMKITHLDVKPNNIMMEDGTNPVLIDFGVCSQYDKKNIPTKDNQMICCSDGYSPIEQYSGITSFSPEADIYALGATLLYMLTGKTPPIANDINEDYFNNNIPQDVSSKLNNILRKCMAKQPEQRFHSIEEILAIIGVDNTTSNEDDDKTKVVGIREYKYNVKHHKNVNWKKIGIATTFVLLLLILSIFFLKFVPSTTEENNTVVHDTVNTVKKDTIKPYEEKKEVVQDIKEVQGEENVIKKENEKVQNKKDIKNENVPKQEGNIEEGARNLDLGYATYEGSTRNGKPHGRGTLIFKTNHAIGNSGKEAIKGEKVVGSFVSGELTQGKWYKNDGSVEKLMIGN